VGVQTDGSKVFILVKQILNEKDDADVAMVRPLRERNASCLTLSVPPRVLWKVGAKAKSYFHSRRRRHRGTTSTQTEKGGYQGA